MDLLFRRYASPFLLLDGMLETGRFSDYVLKFIDIQNDEKIYNLWLHKCYDKSYAEFKDQVTESAKPADPVDLEATIRESEDILKSFIPAG